nr:ABC transporter permease [Allonocardiopsis opalescens]
MSTDVTTPDTAPPVRRGPWRVLSLVLAGFVALSGVRFFTGEATLTASGTVSAALLLAVPIAMAALGGLWAERAGVINIGLEGMMIFGTWFGAAGAYFTGNPWVGLLTGILGGVFGGALHALATVTFGVDHIVSGVAINILALGSMRYLAISFFETEPGGGAATSPPLPGFPRITVPGLSELFVSIESRGWLIVSDLAGVLAGLTTQVSVVTVLAVLLISLSFYILWRTPFGLRLRSVGENPSAAESLGVKVYTFKYAALLVSGGLAGLGGVFLAMVASSAYQEGQTGGRGYIGLAAMIFGNWRPGGLAMGAGLFGYTDALQLRGTGTGVHALLLLVTLGLLLATVWQTVRGRYALAGVLLVAAVLVALWYINTDSLPRQFVTYTPHITTLLVLSLASQRLRPPAAVGVQWRRGQAT